METKPQVYRCIGPLASRWAMILVGTLLVLAIPVFLVTSNVKWMANSVTVWGVLFDRHHVPHRTDTPKTELMDGARHIVLYFNSSAEDLQVVMEVSGRELQVFNLREVRHMADVKTLFSGTFVVFEASGALLGVLIVGGLLVFRRRALFPIAWLLAVGGAVTVGLVLLIGVVAIISFGPLFTTFHVLSFSNDLWQLDPVNSYLVRMFPQGFWQDMTLLIGLASVLEALVLVGAMVLVLRWLSLARR